MSSRLDAVPARVFAGVGGKLAGQQARWRSSSAVGQTIDAIAATLENDLKAARSLAPLDWFLK
jgi:hypothetical protein